MRSASDWFGEYALSHSHPTNTLLHWICVPLVVLSVMGLLWALPVPRAFAQVSTWLNWATLVSLAVLGYYFLLSPRLAIAIGAAFALLFLVVRALEALSWPLWVTSLVIFAAAWTGQFVGHAIEGRRPSFFRDVQFLLVGPLWLVVKLFGRAGLKY